MNSDQKIGVALLIGLVGFALALGFGRKPAEEIDRRPVELTTAENAFAAEIVEQTNPFEIEPPSSATEDVTPLNDIQTVGSLGDNQVQTNSRRAPQQTGWEFLEPVLAPEPMGVDETLAVSEPPHGDLLSTPSDGEPVAKPPQSQTASTETFREYIVKPGDTLSGIAERECGRVGRYFELYEANRETLASPNDLRVGQSLRIPVRLAVSSEGRTR